MAKILIGGLTRAHETLLQAFFQYIGTEVIRLPEPDNEAFKIGKMYSNKGQCNPVYYTVGTLIRYLKRLQERALRLSTLLLGATLAWLALS